MFFRERGREGGGVRGRGRERIPSRLHAGHGPQSHDPKITLKIISEPKQESAARLTEPPRHPILVILMRKITS